jgi:hypothetical protein
MLFMEIIFCLQWELFETHKYKMKCYWLLKQVGHNTVTTGLSRANVDLICALSHCVEACCIADVLEILSVPYWQE